MTPPLSTLLRTAPPPTNLKVSLGTELSLSVGPVGRTASTDIRAGDGGVTAAFSYAHSKGVFIGVSLEAATVVTRKDANRDFYGTKVSAEELLLGDFPAPKAAEPLYRALEEVRADTGGVLEWSGGGVGGCCIWCAFYMEFCFRFLVFEVVHEMRWRAQPKRACVRVWVDFGSPLCRLTAIHSSLLGWVDGIRV